MKTEQRTFAMHPHLLFDVIRRQAGSLDQAVREGVMNAVDAKATAVDVTISDSEVVLKDNGTGFESRRQIETCFETFGQPHEEGERKVFGTFRMGRGQLFAYGRNVWTTGRFTMDVDIANMGLDYTLREVNDVTPGCTVRVTLYKKLNSYEAEALIHALRKSLKWLSTRVYVNGSQESISYDPADRPEGFWTHVTEDAYVRLTENDRSWNSVDIYNMGVFVTTVTGRWQHRAEVVSRKALTLNFARNEVMQGCPVWNRVKGLVQVDRKPKAPAGKKSQKKKGPSRTLKPAERDELARQLVEGEMKPEDGKNLRLVQDLDGKHWSFGMLARVVRGFRGLLTSAPSDSQSARKLRDNGLAFPVSYRTVTRFLAEDPAGLAAALNKLCPALRVKGQSLDEIWTDSYVKVQLVAPEDLSPLEEAVSRTLEYNMHLLGGTRKVRFGVTFGPKHWTDGYSYIGLDREWLVANRVDIRGWFRLAGVVQYELLHKNSTLDRYHTHDEDFYQTVYESQSFLVDFAVECFNEFPRHASECGVEPDDVSLVLAAQEAEKMSVVDQLAVDLLGEPGPDDQEEAQGDQESGESDVPSE